MDSSASTIVWHNVDSNETQIWFMDGERVQRRGTVLGEDGQPVIVGPPWSIVAVGDMDGDGRADILWRTSDDGSMQIWFMDGARVKGRATVVGENGVTEHALLPWSIVAVGDMDGDGRADILWRTSDDGSMQIWFMDGARVKGRATVVGENGVTEHALLPWSIVAVGDMDGDGRADILWRTSDDGSMQIWFMDGARVKGRATVVGENGVTEHALLPWSIVAVGDMDGDGRADILWRTSDDGSMQIWFMDGARVKGRATVVGENGVTEHALLPWSIVGVGSLHAFRDRLKDRIHQQYLDLDGHAGLLGFPTSSVQFSGIRAVRSYRGGDVLAVMSEDGPLGVVTQAFKKLGVSVRFLGFRCLGESNELSASDEPYFVISVDHGAGVPLTKKFGPFENTDQGTEWGVGEVLVDGIAPDPLAIRVMAYENDEGDPDETAKKIQAQMVTLAQQAQSIAAASGAASADGPGLGPSAAAGAVGLVSGPLGALVAVGIVAAMGLGDDFIGQDVALAFTRPESVGTPPSLGTFRGNSFNARVDIDGGNQGHHELFFDIVVTDTYIKIA